MSLATSPLPVMPVAVDLEAIRSETLIFSGRYPENRELFAILASSGIHPDGRGGWVATALAMSRFPKWVKPTDRAA